MEYAIFEGNMERLERKLTRIANKCTKYGCDFRYERKGEEYRKVKDENGDERIAKFIIVEADGTAIINGWQFAATLEHTSTGNIINGVGGLEVPKRFYTCEPFCEHCGIRRARKNTYVVYNTDTDEFKQVGSACLADYTHGLDASSVANYLSYFETLVQGEAPMPGATFTPYIATKEYLAYAAETVRCFGYVPTSDLENRPTARRASEYYHAAIGRPLYWSNAAKCLDEMEAAGFNINKAASTVDDALDWLSEQGEDSNYMHNLKAACAQEYSEYARLGLLASLFPTYDKGLERIKQQKAAARSNYVGTVGARITVKVGSYKCLTGWSTQFGYTMLWKIVDTDGNVFTWKTQNDMPDNVEYITGTVKQHTEYNGVLQTELTRCKVNAAKKATSKPEAYTGPTLDDIFKEV